MVDTSELGNGTGGVWTRRQALEAVTPDVLRGHLRSGRWRRILPGAYHDGGVVPDVAMWSWAIRLTAGEGAVLCGRSAARAWGLPLVDDHDPATGRYEADLHDVSLTHHRGAKVWRSSDGDRVGTVNRYQLVLEPTDLVEHESGLVVTSPGRTLRDLAGLVRADALVCAIDHALRRGDVTTDELLEQVERAAGSRQAKVFRWAVAAADRRAESPAETLARLLLLPHLPGLTPQVELVEPWGEVIARFDLADEELMLAVEVDGRRGHAGEHMVAKDRRRDRRTGDRGWWTERVTWYEIRRQSLALVRRVATVADRRRRRAA
jgi:very-short-patch-repair endonuclease